ncbi:MAG: flavodoxin [Planctomycetota bacterium]|jgi:flavodoxin short chain|nr:flavodoxin [Planctomycetota bacterium]
MAKILIVYWSGTGNTERMAELITGGAKAKGAEVDCKRIGESGVGEALGYDVVAIGSPSMGQEVIEESEVEPFVEELNGKIAGRKFAIFGSYGWGDGEWMRVWAERMRSYGADLLDDGLTVNESPQGDGETLCREWGEKLAAF